MATKHAKSPQPRWLTKHQNFALALCALCFNATVALTCSEVRPVSAYVALMAGQRARPLNGQFNQVPVLHSNQPEEVEGPGILINTAPGSAYSRETGQQLRNAEFTFNGDFGIHMHHKYFPPYRNQITAGGRRSELTIGLILINPGYRPVHLRFSSGAVRNSFEAPYLANTMIGVRPLGPRPWNTGPGDATAIQLLREKLDSKLSEEITIPARSRIVLFQTDLPALGIANALLRGKSDGPFQMAVVAARQPQSDFDLLTVLDQGELAPGRVYLNRIAEINNGSIFSRVGGIAIGDEYKASISHNLNMQGPLHVPLTSTNRHNFGTKEVQVNPLASRMLDSALDNIGTYGVRFNVDLNLQGDGDYDVVLSHPSPVGGRPFIAFRGSIQVKSDEGTREYHVVLKSGQSLALTSLNLKPGVNHHVTIAMVYPADATPGHLLSVVPNAQLSRTQQLEREMEAARIAASRSRPKGGTSRTTGVQPSAPPPLGTETPESVADNLMQPILLTPAPPPIDQGITQPPTQFPPSVGPAVAPPPQVNQTLIDRYQQALEAQQSIMRGLMSR